MEENKKIDFPQDFKTQADQMFAQLNELIEDVNSRISSISKSINELETKLTQAVDTNKTKDE